ncbi:SufD family Fe-S cluster assembly protein [Mycoplasmoides pirum]|uniref:SufD family Fe-S cluster assembly protein n=1 Tax=Mycoplasmoides pirum TaxID=2122 RepID=UPI0006967799|nr:SufD family Fe-S cluster assembly protein [Mycoplasmoides pirum]
MTKEIFLDFSDVKNNFDYLVKENENLTLHLLDIYNKNTDNKILIKLKENSSVKVLLSSFAKKNITKNFLINFEHLEDNAKSTFNSYLIASHLSKIKVKIVSDIKPKTTNSKTSQEIKGVLLSNSSLIHGEPQLIIDDNNVKAKHAMAIGKINPNQIFYLMSRGISEKVAIQLILMGFFNTTLSIIKDKKIWNLYNIKIKKLFSGK